MLRCKGDHRAALQQQSVHFMLARRGLACPRIGGGTTLSYLTGTSFEGSASLLVRMHGGCGFPTEFDAERDVAAPS